ncbi:phosphoribosylaminoimidazolesuccinocarboxamide synthase [Helicobacter mesocricetorum]|uniref:phosphoribosylaminoimidazolesuccinocarboxamide synthase n=1 Tax=Helicobacter mesocricetorum TaxID=87012 RepID=UPI000CF017A0|nr:phosphoribosylaminoimidazolesuccinocarboxamide synthase [Helicobacter mesocricetorum]
MQVEQKEKLYEGKGKKLYKTNDENFVLAEFKDDLTAFNAQKKGNEEGKGALNCKISSEIFKLLEKRGIKTHYVETLADNLMLCQFVEIIPIEVVVRNIATGSLTKRLGIKEGERLPFALVEFYYKDDSLGDPLINDEHALILGCVKSIEILEHLRKIGRDVNEVLCEFFDRRNLMLVDFKLEFGLNQKNEILVADEITPDSCRFWDKNSKEKLDKDRFREDLGGVKMAYEEVLKRILLG